METFLELFESTVKRYESKIAVKDPQTGLAVTYGELNDRAARIAAKLLEQGVGKSDSVAVVLPKGVDFIASMIAASKVGAAFVPLNMLYPQERLQYIYEDCHGKAVITPDFLADVQTFGPITENVRISSEDTAVLVYTSGSTGKPKGVRIDHRALFDSIERNLEGTGVSENDISGLSAPFFFIAGVQGLFVGLCCGMTNVLIPITAMRDPVLLADVLAENEVTRCFISPKILRYFKPKHSGLRTVFTGSERVSGIYSDDFTIINSYGSSETCGGVCYFWLDKAYDNTPVGKPIGDEALYILDENGNEAEEGEICFAGNFADCYLNLPEASAKTFVDNPFREKDGFLKMVRTGDIGKRLPDGNVVYLNRRDWMVKINGQRVEPGETEAALRKLPGIKDAAVKDHTDSRGVTYLAAYYVSETEFDDAKLRLSLKEYLPDYMIPSFFIRMDRLPVNANGKLDRAALPVPDLRSYQSEYAAPETPGQEQLCRAFADILGLDRVGIDDDFFALGGDSVRAAGLMTRIKGLPVAIADIYSGKTVRKITEIMNINGAAGASSDAPVNAAAAGVTKYPLTPMERGMYLEQKLDPDSISYNLNIGIYINGADRDAVHKAVRELFLAHEALHSRYGEDNGVPCRIMENDAPQITDGKTIGRAEFEASLEDPGKQFDIETGIPARLILYPLTGGGYGLHLCIHHIAFDGGSMEFFVNELAALLKGDTAKPEASDLYGMIARRGDTQAEPETAFFEEMFSDGVPTNEMPIKGVRPKKHPLTDTVLTSQLGEKEIAALREKAKQYGVTMFELMLSVSAAVLGQYCVSEDVVVGVPVNTRDSFSSEMIGMFVNTVPVRIRPKHAATISDYFAETAGVVRRASRECSVPFETLVGLFCKERDASRSPLFDMSINFLPVSGPLDDGGIKIDVTSPLQKMGRDIGLVIRSRKNSMQILMQYSSELFDADVAENFLEQFGEALRLLAWSDAVCVRDLTALPERQLAKLEQFSSTARAEITGKLLHKMFEHAADTTPDKTALIASDKTMTFAQLDKTADIIANELINRGVKRDDSVVLLLPRRSFYFAALFGVLKAGAAFIPCDPEYPTDRISLIIGDSDAKYIVTTKDKLANYQSEKALDIETLLGGTVTARPEVEMSPDDLAYMIYTSGSTGKPKGVMLRHVGICSFFTPDRANILYDFEKSDISAILSVTTVSFDLGLKDTLGMLVNGRTVVFADEEQMNDPRELTALFEKTGADAINATPSRYLQYMEYEPFRKALAKCKLIVAGGEQYPAALLKKLREETGARLINTYGPTETTISANMAELTAAERVTAGRPLLNYTEYIVDREGNRVPRGVTGELLIGGSGVALGYRGLPEMTASRFVNYNGMRVYRSGDYARYDAQGNVEILGRMDNQVKLRGLRIELGEIEGLMEQQPGIKRAVAAIRPLNGQDELCAWFTADSPTDISALRDELKKHLTSYMVPAAIMQLDDIPVTPNGKTDMKTLPTPEPVREETVPPQNEMQQKIFDITAAVIGGDNFGIDTDLYFAGLTSLNSVNLSIKLSDAFAVNVQIRDLREHNTVRKLEALILGMDKDEGFTLQDEYAITKIQEGVFFETQTHPGTTIYNIPTLIVLDKAVDTARLKTAVVSAIEAHPYLKVRFFVNENGEIRQKRNDSVPFTEADITEIRCDSIDEVKDGLAKSFDLVEDSLFRVSMIYTPSGNYLFVDVHHVIYDGTARVILMRDISRAYAGEQLAPEAYSGYEAAQLEECMRASEHYTKAKEYYTGMFGGCEPDSLPMGDAQEDDDGSGIIFTKGTTDASAVAAFCAENGMSENAFYTAVFGYVAAKYCGRDDIVFTTVNNGRNDPRFADSVSMFVKTYPVLCKTGSRGLKEYIGEISGQLIDSLAYDVYSFEEISRELGIRADVLFAFQGIFSGGMKEFCGLPCSTIEPNLNEAKACIEFQTYPNDSNTVTYYCHFRKSLYTEKFMRRFIRTYDLVLREFMRREKLSDIELTDDETLKELDSFNATARDYEITDIVTLFRRQVKSVPDNIAVAFKDIRLTYKQTDDITDRVAAYLANKGIGRGDAVSVLIPKCEYVVLASLGVLKSGAVYQPLDPSYPSERLEFMISDADAKLVIADRSLTELIPNYSGDILFIDEISSLPPADVRPAGPAPEDGFILLYTSGSTGTPKGVMLEHRNLCNFCAWYRNYYELTPSSRVAAYASYGFDASMMDTYPALTTGACVYIIPEEIRLDFPALQRYFDSNEITHSFMTTQVGRQFASYYSGTSLKHLSIGGETLAPVSLEGKSFTFYNAYGPTECTIFSTIFPVNRLYRRVPIGNPLDNFRLYVVDNNGKILPPGIPGELWISGRGVGRGYLNRPQKNAEVFIANPFANEQGYDRVYRTGDVVRWTEDGLIDFVGRSDSQVKIRGFRIELTEVETIIREFEGVADATVQAFDAPSGGKYLAAYIVGDEKIDVDALCAFIAKNKPPYMVPEAVMQIDKIPLNQNQKVNKRALPKPERKQIEIVPVQNETQQKISDCIAEVIGTAEFGITTDIFDAGLNSIGSIKLNVLLSNAFGVPVSIKDLREHSTVQELEEFLAQGTDTEAYEIQTDYPITQTQNGIFIECVAHPNTTMYNIPFLFRLSDTIDTDRLKKAVEVMIKAHPYLGTTLFLNESGDIRAKRDDSMQPEVELITADDLPENMVQPFELMNSRLYRVKIYRTKSGNYLFLECHHIVCDGMSELIMIDDINAAYGGTAPAVEKYTGFEVALDEEKARNSERYAAAKEYYDKIFGGVDTDFLPPADADGGEASSNKFSVQSALDVNAIKAYCEKQGVTLNAFFNAVFAFVLAKYNYKTEAVYTTIYNGRNDSRLSRCVTMLVKTFPVHCSLDGETDIAGLIKATGEQLIGSMENDTFSFAEISRTYNIPADIMFAYQGENFSFSSIGGAPAEVIPLRLSETKAPLNVNVFIKDGHPVFSCDHRSDRYTEEFMRGFVSCMEKAAEEFTVKTKVKEVSILGEKAKATIDGFNATEVRIPHTTCNKLFEEQVRKNPDKTAVIAGNERLTYTELNECANKIAHSLIDGGVRLDEMVGVMMPRTVYAYAAREGILKAGAAFMPLAPDYPDERVSYIIENSGSGHVVTTGELAEERKALFEAANVTVHVVEEMLKSDRTDDPETGVQPENLCYCIYTSGSTGRPKGVMIEHHSLVNFVDHNPINVQSCEFVDNMTVSLALAALTFDVSVLEESLGLYHGGTVAMATEEEINNPLLLAQMIERNGVDVMKCTPSYMNNMLDVPQVAKTLSRMKAIDIGAEAFPAPLYDKMLEAGITAKIHNGYGPTEATITTSIDPLTSNRITIGRPLCNTKVVMLDKSDNVLPPDVPGELTILGECVGRGYVANEKLTNEKFITYQGYRAYRSGDLARFSKDGKILFMGRMDNQVKLRGLRIELDEIEAVMNSFPSVTQSVVLVKENEAMGQFLCAYFAADVKVDHDELAAHLSKRLAKYMVPSVFMQLDSIPINANGKADRRALPEPKPEARETGYTAPTTELQKKLCDMFAYALGTDKVSVTDNFFEIGGTSLNASKIAMKAMMENLPIAFKDIFDHPTVLDMEKYLNASSASAPGKKEAAVKTAESGVLSHNTAEYVDRIFETRNIGNVLLTGATGFLGIHVLKCLLDHTDKTVYCLLRGGRLSVEERLKSRLMYYFDDPMEDLFGNRIIAVKGDITDVGSIKALKDEDFLTVINCAACVKHFVQDDTLDRINWHGVENLIDFCVNTDRRLVHVSTVSVAGSGTVDKFSHDTKIHENELYIGQNLDNKYANTKYKAEQALLDAVTDRGLDGKIIRVGNLMNRYRDGEFQINFETNNFMRSLRAYASLGIIPFSALDRPVEFSPIGYVAGAVVLLATTDKQFTVFHATNGHLVQMGDVVEAMNRIGITLKPVRDEEFRNAFSKAMSDENMSEMLSPLISYKGSEREAAQFWIGHDNSFTAKALYRLGLKWPIIDEQYLEHAFRALDTLGFFRGA